VVVFPLAALTVLGYRLHGHVPALDLDWRLLLHAWLALLAYATLAIAALLAIMSWLQERALRRRQLHPWLRALPPLVELETLLFRTVTAGFVLLSAALLTGALFVEDLLAQHLVHKTVLSVVSWLAFAALLIGRWRLGWRGSVAVRWTLVAMALLLLAVFGSKFVLELVLQRP
ncbi:MAG: cytochrome c biogenesis protein CcsA, partial [Lysobacter sp.]|nr:cytochrome c biogenesis protein CcsA [Lysobacter sp.]